VSDASHKCRCQELRSEPRILSAAIYLATTVPSVAAHVSLHVGDVVELGNIAIFLHVWPFMLRHGGEQVFNDFVGDERVAEVELCDIWLEAY
jgi:hypothetical protein